jgi:O-antigen/teichoic acid export membrane protein
MRELRVLTLLIGSGVAAQGLMLLGNLLLARLYAPAAFGDLGVLASVASLVAVVAGLRYDYVAFAQPDENKAPLVALALWLALGLHALFLVGAVLAVLSGVGTLNAALWLWIFSLTTSLCYLATQGLVALGDYKYFARMRLLQALAQIGFGLLFVSLEGATGLLMAFAGSQATVALFIFIQRPAMLKVPEPVRTRRLFAAHHRLALPNSLLVLIQYSTPFAPVLLARLHFSAAEAGAYFLFAAAVSAPLAIFRRSLINLLNGEVASPARAQHLLAGLSKAHQRVPAALSLLALAFICLALGLFAGPICALVFGNAWVPYANLLLPLVLFHVLDAALQPFTTLLPLWGRQAWAMGLEVLRFVLVFLAVPAGVIAFHWDFHTAVLCYFGFMSLVYLVNFGVVWRQVAHAPAVPAAGKAV